MNRKDFLLGAGVLGLGLSLPKVGNFALSNRTANYSGGCVLIPSETAGPFPLDLTENDFYFRQDVREDRVGSQLNLRMKIKGLEDCLPMQNVRVNIWHCDNVGNYSGYNSEAGETYLRGYQITDANGEVEFITVFPGWYPGRVCHIHFQVYVSETYAAISQLTWDHDSVNDVYNNNTELYPDGEDPETPDSDNIFNDGYEQQVATLTENPETGGYDSYIEVTVQGSGTVGFSNREKEMAKIFELGQNFPNPFQDETTVPVVLKEPARISLDLYDLNGQKIKCVFSESRSAGSFEITIDFKKLGISPANYVYQLEVQNDRGVFRLPKLMTVAQ